VAELSSVTEVCEAQVDHDDGEMGEAHPATSCFITAERDPCAELIWSRRGNASLKSLWFTGRVTYDGVFVLYHAAGKLQSFMQIITFRRHQRPRQKLARHLGRGRLLKFLDEMTGGFKTGLPFGFLSNVCRLKGKIDASGGAVRLIRRHDLLAEHEAHLRGQFDTRSGAKSDGGAVNDHHFASPKIQNKTHFYIFLR
jgi:hypothetical protein